jgi:hypothetical protein
MSPGQHPRPADLGKAGCSWPPAPAATADHPAQKGHQPEPLNHVHYQRAPRPAARHDPHPARRPGGYQGTGTRLSHAPDQGNHDRIGPRADRPPRNLTREPSREPSSGSTGRSQACPIGGKPTGPRPLSNSCTPTGPRRPPHARFPETVTEHACGHRRMQVRRIYVRALTIDRPRSMTAGVLRPGSAASSSRVGRPVAASADSAESLRDRLPGKGGRALGDGPGGSGRSRPR